MADPINTASLAWEDGAVLRSTQYNDIYFSDIDGLAETRHVFIDGNDLPTRFARLGDSPPQTVFNIGELGFGTGLNILALMDAWQQRGHNHGHLHIFSIEGFPLDADDFAKAHQRIRKCWPELAAFSLALVDQYPPLMPGHHVLRLQDDVTLTLAFGEADSVLSEKSGNFDAWLLDGFSPAENPAMWSPGLMQDIARLSSPGTTAATFTVAGSVRRALSGAGFEVAKTPGFGRKREMLTARRSQQLAHSAFAPWFSYGHLSRQKGARVAIMGAGIAGASLAWHLKRAGFDVSVYDREGHPAKGASGNPAGLVLPRLDLGDTAAARFYRSSFLYTVNLIHAVEQQTSEEIFLARGGLKLSHTSDTQQKSQKLIAENIWPADIVKPLSTNDVNTLSGHSLNIQDTTHHLFVGTGGTIQPAAFVRALLADTTIMDGEFLSCDPGAQPEDSLSVRLKTPSSEQTIDTDYLILATSLDAGKLLDAPHLTASLGQLDIVDAKPPHLALSFGHYAAPYYGKTIIGATYENVEPMAEYPPSAARSGKNLSAIADVLPEVTTKSDVAFSRTAIRAVTADRHPVAGPLPDWAYYHEVYQGLRHGRQQAYPPAQYLSGVYVLTGLGSRGLTTAPYCASLLTSLLTGASPSVSHNEIELVHPARFLVRNLRRNQ